MMKIKTIDDLILFIEKEILEVNQDYSVCGEQIKEGMEEIAFGRFVQAKVILGELLELKDSLSETASKDRALLIELSLHHVEKEILEYDIEPSEDYDAGVNFLSGMTQADSQTALKIRKHLEDNK
jgi:predicted DNA-binding protein